VSDERPAYDPEHFPPNEFVELDGLLYPHAVWLDAINTAGALLMAERVKGSPRAMARALRQMRNPDGAAAVRRRARDLMRDTHPGLAPGDAPDGWRVVGVVVV